MGSHSRVSKYFTQEKVGINVPGELNLLTLCLIYFIEGLGMTYLADPICDDVHATLPLEVHIITFTSSYYTTSQGTARIFSHVFIILICTSVGRKKLKQVEAEVNRLSSISHPNLLACAGR